MNTPLKKFNYIDISRVYLIIASSMVIYATLISFIPSVGLVAILLIATILSLLAYPMIRDRNQERHEQSLMVDALTCLPNRIAFQNTINELLKKDTNNLAILLIDIDNFRYINESIGHDNGDLLLQKIATQISESIRTDCILARMGEDSFVIAVPQLPPGVESVARIENKAQRIINKVHTPFMFQDHQMYMSVSIGIVICVNELTTFDELMHKATEALYQAKIGGRNRYYLHDCENDKPLLTRMELQNGLYQAIESNEIVAYYQPQLEIKTGTIVGAEALARWIHPTWGMISPSTFIPVAEDSSLINNIGDKILLLACQECKRWHDAGAVEMKVSVNLSTKQFQDDIVTKVCRTLTKAGLHARFLELEVTESISIEDTDKTIEILKELKSLGISIAMDDFGTGYSSLSYIKNLPIDIIKIDQSFIKDQPSDAGNVEPVIKAVLLLAKELKIQTIAEGVETQEQLNLLHKKGCDIAQGYYISKPLSAEEFFNKYMK